MKIKSSQYPGWNNFPIYTASTWKDYCKLTMWMRANGVEHFLLSSGCTGYTFQVKHNHEWFVLRWM